ncbi:MAG: hypothetical protein M1133_03245 [Armatimonadetes bacterium]|nr:hypothetical protein [Armatimonadota bacterium]
MLDIFRLLSKSVTGLNGKTYYCRVQAKDNAGNLSSWSGNSNGITVVTNAGVSIAAARHLPDSATVGLSGKVVTGIFGDCLYIEEPGRTAGIRVVVPTVPSGIVIGSMVDVGGTLMTNAAGERYIAAGAIEKGVAH